jgi:hypothetical protein
VTSGPGEDDRLYDGTDITIYAGAAYTHGRCRHTGIYDIFSGWTKESNNYTAAGLLEIAAYVAEHKEQLEQEAIARREELANE